MLIYPSLCRKAVQMLGRVELGSAGEFLNVDKSVRVSDASGNVVDTYATVQPIALVLLTVYAFGIPIGIGMTMRVMRLRLGE